MIDKEKEMPDRYWFLEVLNILIWEFRKHFIKNLLLLLDFAI